MKKRMKNPVIILLALIFTMLLSFASFAAEGWNQEEGAWCYYRNGNRLVNEWLDDNGKTYYLGADGRMLTGNRLIDGHLYSFNYKGFLDNDAVSTVWQDHKVFFDENGRGTLTTLSADDALYSSTYVKWMDQTFRIYTEYFQIKEFQTGLSYSKLPSEEELLAKDWGITDKDSGISTINRLFNAGVATDNKEIKAWNFSRAMLICNAMYKTRWIDLSECRTLQHAMAPTIQQSFSSWEDFFDHYMVAYCNWDNAVGSKEIDTRKEAYKAVKHIMSSNDEFSGDPWIQWDKELVKLW